MLKMTFHIRFWIKLWSQHPYIQDRVLRVLEPHLDTLFIPFLLSLFSLRDSHHMMKCSTCKNSSAVSGSRVTIFDLILMILTRL